MFASAYLFNITFIYKGKMLVCEIDCSVNSSTFTRFTGRKIVGQVNDALCSLPHRRRLKQYVW